MKPQNEDQELVQETTSNSNNDTISPSSTPTGDEDLDGQFESNNLFIFHLPSSVEDDELEQLFGKFGKILSVKVMKNKETGESKGTLFLLMCYIFFS